jgi:hypothetical protein
MPKFKFFKKKDITPTKVKTIILSLVIAIVLSAFVIYLIQAIYPNPEYEDFCDENRAKLIPIPENRELVGGTCATVSPNSREECCINKGYESYNEELAECKGNLYEECQKEYNTARDQYRLVIFIVAVIAGLMAVSMGIILALPSVSSGLMLGGTFLTFYGTAIYWSKLNNWLRVIILGIVLAILIWLGYQKLKN